MKAYELPIHLTQEGKIEIPDEVAELLREGLAARVIFLVEEPDERAWSRLSQEQFLKGYSEADAVYDGLD